MRRILTTALALAAALALGGSARAAPAGHVPKADATRSHSAIGKVTRYDPETRTLTLATKNGEDSFVLASDARVMRGARKVSDIGATVGQNAKVHYTEADGVKTARSIAVSRKTTGGHK